MSSTITDSVITDFWAAHPECWIPITQAQKAHADKLITERFYNYDYENENLPGRAIFLDQFQRHFQRHLGAVITEEHITKCRQEAVEDVDRNADELICYKEADLVACLMPFKHLGRFTYIFDYLHNTWLPDMGWSDVPDAECITTYPVLARFYYDTYRKWQTDATIADNLIVVKPGPHWIYDAAVCESDAFPESLDGLKEGLIADTLAAADKGTIVSLSGGIDSMVALTVLKALGKEPQAVHIIYGNRHTSHDEFCFVANFCNRLGVPLTAYEIPHIRRDSVARDFYESVTRAIRFGVYRVVADGKKVLLGHIQDDCIENVWTNFARGIHLDNLTKMEANETQLDVALWRPLLAIPKSLIYEVAATHGIPHLKNTTPSWANRGKFREHFYAETHKQYGPDVDRKLLEVAATLKAQAALIDRLLYQQIYTSWNPDARSVDVGPALVADLDAEAWLKIFEHVCHKYLQVNRPSIHAMREFVRRIRTAPSAEPKFIRPLGPKSMRMNIGKSLAVTLDGSLLQFTIPS
jgi:tRNA(Ile)-lysidine synthetase-like protein